MREFLISWMGLTARKQTWFLEVSRYGNAFILGER
jgi:hypothetical protein